MADADSFMMMALEPSDGSDGFRFGLSTAAYQELNRTHSWRWPTVDVIGARPSSQYVGLGEDSISMSGVIYPHFRGGLGQIQALRRLADKGVPFLVVDGTGQVWGKYVITDIREGQKVFFANGAPRRQDFDLTLQAYGGNPTADAPNSIGSVPAAATPST